MPDFTPSIIETDTPDESPIRWVHALEDDTRITVAALLWNLQPGDVIVTRDSNTRRKILSREGNRFHFLTTQEFRGHSALNWNFSREKGGKILTKEDVTSLPLGTKLYGPKDVLMEIIEIKDNGSTVVFRYEETKNVSQEQIQWKRYVVQRQVA